MTDEIPTYYDGDVRSTYLELHDHHSLWKLDNPKVKELKPFMYEDWMMLITVACQTFRDMTGVDVFLLGRSGRHACVEDTEENRENYYKLKQTAIELEKATIEAFNSLT